MLFVTLPVTLAVLREVRPVREKEVEQYLVRRVKQCGGLCLPPGGGISDA